MIKIQHKQNCDALVAQFPLGIWSEEFLGNFFRNFFSEEYSVGFGPNKNAIVDRTPELRSEIILGVTVAMVTGPFGGKTVSVDKCFDGMF